MEIPKATYYSRNNSRFLVSCFCANPAFSVILSSYGGISGIPNCSSVILSDSALVARALIENPTLIRWSLVLKAVSGLVALICGNGYIVGINQIYDIGIDKYAIAVVILCTLVCNLYIWCLRG